MGNVDDLKIWKNFLAQTMPLLRDVEKLFFSIRLSFPMAEMLKRGYPIVDILQPINEVDNDWSRTLKRIKEGIESGEKMNSVLKSTQKFPDFFQELFAIGFASGDLAEKLEKATEIAGDKLKTMLESTAEKFELAFHTIIFLGCLVLMYGFLK